MKRGAAWEEASSAARTDDHSTEVAPSSWPGASVLRAPAHEDGSDEAGDAVNVGGADATAARAGSDDARLGVGGDATDEDLGEGSLGSLRAVWASMRDEEPPASGMDELLAAARAVAARAAVRTSRWQRVATMWRRLVRR